MSQSSQRSEKKWWIERKAEREARRGAFAVQSAQVVAPEVEAAVAELAFAGGLLAGKDFEL